jgi:hypothetical protein
MPSVAVLRRQQAQVRAACDQLLNELQVRGIVLNVEHQPGARARCVWRGCGQCAVLTALDESRVRVNVSAAELDPEHAANTDGTLRADAALHQLHQALAHDEADAGALLARGFFAKTIEGLETAAPAARA